jgi:HEPN domain-containing protein
LPSINEEYVIAWLRESQIDLECGKILYENKIFSRTLYHLQQSNGKLAKGLLISIGILTPKKAGNDLITKLILGFQPKEPRNYNHRIYPSLLSDLEKATQPLNML